MRCRLCNSVRLVSVVDLGATPPCEKFLTASQLDLPEPTYPLHVRLCERCLLLQIPALVAPNSRYTEYGYSRYDAMARAAQAFIDDVARTHALGPDSFVVEVASNDGYLLRHAAAKGIRCLGVEPTPNLGATARSRGVPTVTGALDEKVAARIRADYGPADLVIANNVYTQVCDLIGFTRALKNLLAEDGWLAIEVPHALNLVTHGQFDAISHEEFHYFTVLSASRALATAGIAVVDVERIPARGGSIRIWARREMSAAPPSTRVAEVLQLERAAGLHRVDGYMQLCSRVEALRHALLRFLLDCHAEGKRVVGYGAPGRSNTLLNYCGIRSDMLAYIVDPNPDMHGCFTPGTRIPIYEPAQISADRPDVVLALPWSLEGELVAELAHIAEWGGELVFPLPTLHTAISPKSGGKYSGASNR